MEKSAGPIHVPPFIVPVFIPHAGCPYRCVFCNQNLISGTPPDALGPDRIRHTIDRFLSYRKNGGGPVQIAFYGGNFLGLPKEAMHRFLSIAKSYVDQGLADGIRFSTRPDTIDEERLAVLDRYPISVIELGAQSMQDKVLTACRRGHRAEDTIRAVRLLRRRSRCKIGLQLMTGLPGEGEEEPLLSGGRAAALAPDFVRIYPTIVLQDSILARWYKTGRYTPMTLSSAVVAVRDLYLLFSENRIPVVRMGLQDAPELNDENLCIAGPYHPAFGHLVLSRIMRDRICSRIDRLPGPFDRLTIRVHPKSESRLRGMRNENARFLTARYGLKALHIVSDKTTAPNEFHIDGQNPDQDRT